VTPRVRATTARAGGGSRGCLCASARTHSIFCDQYFSLVSFTSMEGLLPFYSLMMMSEPHGYVGWCVCRCIHGLRFAVRLSLPPPPSLPLLLSRSKCVCHLSFLSVCLFVRSFVLQRLRSRLWNLVRCVGERLPRPARSCVPIAWRSHAPARLVRLPGVCVVCVQRKSWKRLPILCVSWVRPSIVCDWGVVLLIWDCI